MPTQIALAKVLCTIILRGWLSSEVCAFFGIASAHSGFTIPPHAMLIREAKPEDVEVIADFNLRLARETEDLALNPETVRAGVGALLQDRARGLYYVAEIEGRIVGQLMITYEWSDWRNGNIWWLQSVYVAAEHRGSGVFRALFNHLERLAAADPGVCTLRLYMHEDNSVARRSYEKLGMLPTHYLVFEKEMRPSAVHPA